MSPCWLWSGYRDRAGYGVYTNSVRRALPRRAHQLVFSALVGQIPNGYVLDHLCKNVGCVNPDHLEIVTPEENRRRGNGTQTHCKRGHPFDAVNTRLDRTKRPQGYQRVCLACKGERGRRRYAEVRHSL